jgi:hypothetical protein
MAIAMAIVRDTASPPVPRWLACGGYDGPGCLAAAVTISFLAVFACDLAATGACPVSRCFPFPERHGRDPGCGARLVQVGLRQQTTSRRRELPGFLLLRISKQYQECIRPLFLGALSFQPPLLLI